MRLFETQSLWDTTLQDWQEHYFVDEQEVELDEYVAMQELEETLEDEEFECFGECELSDTESEEIIMLAEATKVLMETDMCPQCVFEALFTIYHKGKRIGSTDAKDKFRELIETI